MEVDVVCAPRVTLNGDILGHCRPPEWTRVCLKDEKQQQMANFAQLCNLLLLLYVFALSHFFVFLSAAVAQQFIEFLRRLR